MPSPFWPRDYGEPVTAIKVAAFNAFNPTSLITGAGGFWRADMGVTTSSGNVTQWNDQSSFANNLTNGGTAANLTFSSTGFNTSFSAVTVVDNTNGQAAISAAFGATTTASMFMLMTPNSGGHGDAYGSITVTGTANDVTTPSFLCYDGSSTNFQCISGSTQGNGGSGFSIPNGTPTLVGIVFDGTHANVWQNGAVVGAATNFSSNVGGTTPTFGIGANSTRSGTGSHYAFWGFTQKAMNTTDWTNLKTWSNNNWGTSF